MLKFSSRDVGEVLRKLNEADRLPVSLGVLAALTGRESEDTLVYELDGMGVTIATLGGDMRFVTNMNGIKKEFVPQAVYVRDQVLGLLDWDHPQPLLDMVVKETCLSVTDCGDSECRRVHFEPDYRPTTEPTLGFCSYLNLCKKQDCKYMHFKYEENGCGSCGGVIPPPLSQFITADIRRIDLSMFHSLVRAVVIDPPWDIHMELSYGTMTDDEMRNLNIGSIHDENFGGFVFVWSTVRTLEVARECMQLWGYEYVDEIVWVKTNMIGGTVRSGRTGHWFNHNKEHCLIGIKGGVGWSSFGKYRMDCDVIVAPVRETSRKPDELYGLVERLVGGERKGCCLELFGRKHNLRNNWITVGNQLDGNRISDELLKTRLDGYT